RALVERATQSVEGRFAEGAQRERQRRILRRASAFVDEILSRGRMEAAALQRFVRDQRVDGLENMKGGAREQVVTMHATVEAWKVQMSAEEMARLRVVVSTVHMARTGNVAVQYFQAALGEASAGALADERVATDARVFVAENVFGEEQS